MQTYWLVKKTTDGTVVSPAKVVLPTLNIPLTDPKEKKEEAPPPAEEAPAEG